MGGNFRRPCSKEKINKVDIMPGLTVYKILSTPPYTFVYNTAEFEKTDSTWVEITASHIYGGG